MTNNQSDYKLKDWTSLTRPSLVYRFSKNWYYGFYIVRYILYFWNELHRWCNG